MSENSFSNSRDFSDSTTGQAERKKNTKLGYQRTSVACRHCRRRKIRCQPNEADPNGPCLNCLRMKKECVTVPIQDAPSPDDKPRPRTETSSLSTASTPGAPLSQTLSHVSSSNLRGDDAGFTPMAAVSSHDNLPALTQPSTSYGTYSGHATPLNYSLPHEPGSASWRTPQYDYSNSSNTLAPVSSADSSYYATSEPQYLTSHSPPFEHSQHNFQYGPQSSTNANFLTGAYVRGPPARSMSYGDAQSHRPYVTAMTGPPFEGLRRVVTMQQPPMAANISSQEPLYQEGASFRSQAAAGAPYTSSSQQQQQQQFLWNQYSQQDHGTGYPTQPGSYGGQ